MIDIEVDDEAAAVRAARRYLSFFQGALPTWHAADPLLLRDALPENRVRVYDDARRDAAASPTPARCSSCAPASASAS